MDTRKARHLLDRINRFFDDFSAAEGQPTALERDLLKQYVRSFYEELSAEAVAPVVASTTKATPAVPPTKVPTPAFSFDAAPAPAPAPSAPVQAAAPPPAPAPVQEKPAPPPPRLIEIPAEVEAEVRRIEAVEPTPVAQQVPAAVREAAPAAPVQAEAQPPSPFTPSPGALSAETKELFQVKRGNDLMGKLAGTPVKDLTKAMAINERLVAQSSLFGGSQAELDLALEHLNTLSSFDDAVSYLGGGVAKKYAWAADERKDEAQTFIKLVRRRYA